MGFRGYNAIEVDEHIEFLIEKYTELYKANLELEKQLASANERLEQLSDEEEAIRKTLVKAQKVGETLIQQAQEKADSVIAHIRERSDAIISETEAKIAAEKEEISALRASTDEFREKLLELYLNEFKFLKESRNGSLEDVLASVPAGGDLKKQLLSVDANAAVSYGESEN